MNTESTASSSLRLFRTRSAAARKARGGASPTASSLMMQRGTSLVGLRLPTMGRWLVVSIGHKGKRTCMFTMPSGEAGFEVKAQKGKTRGQLLLAPNGDVGLTLNDAAERPRVRFRVSADGKTATETPAAAKSN